MLVTYPALSAAAPSVLKDAEDPGPDGRVHFGLVLNVADPPYCTDGYLGPVSQWRPATDKTFIPMDTNVRCDEAPAGQRPRGPGRPPPYDSENPGNPAGAGGTGSSQNEAQDTTMLASLPPGGVLEGSQRGAPPVIIPGLGD